MRCVLNIVQFIISIIIHSLVIFIQSESVKLDIIVRFCQQQNSRYVTAAVVARECTDIGSKDDVKKLMENMVQTGVLE